MPPAGPSPALPIIGFDPHRVDAAAGGPKHPLGTEIRCNDGTTRRYVRAGAATITASLALKLDAAEGVHDVDPTTAVAQPVAGVAPPATAALTIADNDFFWMLFHGSMTVKVAAAITAGAHLASTAVLGELDDVVAAAADAQAAAAGVGVVAITDDTPAAGFARAFLNG